LPARRRPSCVMASSASIAVVRARRLRTAARARLASCRREARTAYAGLAVAGQGRAERAPEPARARALVAVRRAAAQSIPALRPFARCTDSSAKRLRTAAVVWHAPQADAGLSTSLGRRATPRPLIEGTSCPDDKRFQRSCPLSSRSTAAPRTGRIGSGCTGTGSMPLPRTELGKAGTRSRHRYKGLPSGMGSRCRLSHCPKNRCPRRQRRYWAPRSREP
jgi:hypothetical protein